MLTNFSVIYGGRLNVHQSNIVVAGAFASVIVRILDVLFYH